MISENKLNYVKAVFHTWPELATMHGLSGECVS